jgi:hypothetical protein
MGAPPFLSWCSAKFCSKSKGDRKFMISQQKNSAGEEKTPSQLVDILGKVVSIY